MSDNTNSPQEDFEQPQSDINPVQNSTTSQQTEQPVTELLSQSEPEPQQQLSKKSRVAWGIMWASFALLILMSLLQLKMPSSNIAVPDEQIKLISNITGKISFVIAEMNPEKKIIDSLLKPNASFSLFSNQQSDNVINTASTIITLSLIADAEQKGIFTKEEAISRKRDKIISISLRKTAIEEMIKQDMKEKETLEVESALNKYQNEADSIQLALDIYALDAINADRADELLQRIQTANQGWIDNIMKAYVMNRIGKSAEAKQTRDKAISSAFSTVRIMMFVVTIMGAAFLAGIGFLVFYTLFAKRRRKENGALRPLMADKPVEYTTGLVGGTISFLWITHLGSSLALAITVKWLKHNGIEIDSNTNIIMLACVQTIFGFISLLWLLTKANRKGISGCDLGLRTDNLLKDIGWGIGGYCAMLPILMFAALWMIVFMPFMPWKENVVNELGTDLTTLPAKFALLFLLSCYAPFFEEIFFRGCLFQAIWRRTNKLWLAITISSLLFAIIHPSFIISLLPLTVIAAVLCVLYAERRSLIPSFILHSVHNGLLGLMVIALFSN